MSFKNRILTRLIAVLLLLIGTSGIQKALACHWASGEMWVDYVGAGLDGCTGTTEYKYVVHVVLYFACQDCTGDQRDSFQVNYRSANDPGGTFNVHEIKYDTVSQICPNFWNDNSCSNLANKDKYPAYKRIEFESWPLTLNTTQPDWKFSFENCCRPVPKNGPSGTFYLETVLNNVNKYNKSTPRFTADPLRYLCVNLPNRFQNSPKDPNNDSMVVTPQASLDAGGAPYTLTLPYTLGAPIDASTANPYYVDPNTGTATFTPTATGMYQIAFRVTSYERGTGIMLGYSIRDINIQILACSEPPPGVDSLPLSINDGKVVTTSTGAKIIYTCPGNTLKFEVASKALLNTSQLYLEAELPAEMVPNAQFTSPNNGSSAVTGTFEWTPTDAQIGEYKITIHSKDSTCNGTGYTLVQRTASEYTIIVIKGLDLGPDIPVCVINNTPKQLFAKGGDNLKLQWQEIIDGVIQPGTPKYLSNPTIQNPISNPNRNVTYTVTSPDLTNKCKIIDTIYLYVDTSTTIDAFPDNPVIMCKPDYLQFDSRLKGEKPTGNIGCGIIKPIECLDPDTVTVLGSLAYGELAKYDTLGPSTPVFPNDVKTAKVEYLIQRSEIMARGMRSGTIKSLGFDIKYAAAAPDPIQEYRNFTIKVKCTKVNKLNSGAGFQSDNTMTEVYRSPAPMTFSADTRYDFTFSQPYNWDTTQNLIIQICYANVDHQSTCTNPKGNAPALKFVPTETVSALFYKAADTGTKDICAIKTDAKIKELTARPIFYFGYCEAPPEDYNIRWSGNLISDSTIQQPLAYIPRSTTYYVQTFGRRGCLIRDSIEIYLPVRDYSVTPSDSSICYGNEAVMTVNKGFHYKWYEYTDKGEYKVPAAGTLDCFNCQTVRVRPLATTNYRIVIYDSVWCTDTITARVNVLPLPSVKLLNNDTIIRYGSSVQLLATGARQYNWMPSGSLNTPNTAAPVATPTERTTYVVAGVGSNGCRSYDTVTVDVNKRENVFVPTAFSPNGDGKNDVFKVTNMTFQRIMEFRVFNRWGQEIFSTTDAKGGWDGTWKGEPQPVGNYRYMIRVGYPDGLTETYTGDVTLIR